MVNCWNFEPPPMSTFSHAATINDADEMAARLWPCSISTSSSCYGSVGDGGDPFHGMVLGHEKRPPKTSVNKRTFGGNTLTIRDGEGLQSPELANPRFIEVEKFRALHFVFNSALACACPSWSSSKSGLHTSRRVRLDAPPYTLCFLAGRRAYRKASTDCESLVTQLYSTTTLTLFTSMDVPRTVFSPFPNIMPLRSLCTLLNKFPVFVDLLRHNKRIPWLTSCFEIRIYPRYTLSVPAPPNISF